MAEPDYQNLLKVALEEARLGMAEGGIPIGAALFDGQGRLLGRGHNRRVQESGSSEPFLMLHTELAKQRVDHGLRKWLCQQIDKVCAIKPRQDARRGNRAFVFAQKPGQQTPARRISPLLGFSNRVVLNQEVHDGVRRSAVP